ncbi:MAG: protein-export chaperone SecB [bacterium]
MEEAPLRLRHYFITRIHIKAHSKYNPKKPYIYEAGSIQTEQKVYVNKKIPGVWQVRLNLKNVQRNSENIPYTFNLEIVGFFETTKKHTKSTTDMFIHFNAPAILYSAAREIIASATGRGPWGSILIPVIRFLPQLRKIPKTGKKSRKKTK